MNARVRGVILLWAALAAIGGGIVSQMWSFVIVGVVLLLVMVVLIRRESDASERPVVLDLTDSEELLGSVRPQSCGQKMNHSSNASVMAPRAISATVLIGPVGVERSPLSTSAVLHHTRAAGLHAT